MNLPLKHDTEHALERAIANYRATGRIVTVYPRKYRISLNGGRSMPYAEAYKRMRDLLSGAA